MKNNLLHVYLSESSDLRYVRKSLLSSKMPNKHNTESQPYAGVLQTPDFTCAPLRYKLSKIEAFQYD